MRGRTTFVVANRLSLLRHSDIILVLEQGRLTLRGTHEELVQVPGPYRETAFLQLMDLDESRGDEAAKPGTSHAAVDLAAQRPKPFAKVLTEPAASVLKV
jgi:hypothetical protein